MKSFFALLVLVCFAGEAGAQVTREDLRKTVVHIQQLSRQQKAELDAAKEELGKTKEALSIAEHAQIAAGASLADANKKADVLQTQINTLRDERDAAVRENVKLKAVVEKQATHIRRLRMIGATIAALASVFLIMSFRLQSFVPPPYNLIILVGGPVAVFALTYAIL